MLLTPSMLFSVRPKTTPKPTTPIKPTGTIKFYDPKRNYGMCTLQDGREVFVLSKSLPVNYIPVENDTIEFDLDIQVRSSGSEKLHAQNITFLSSPSSSSSITSSATTKINTSPLTTTTDAYSVMQASNKMSLLQLKPTPTVPTNRSNSKSDSKADPFSVVKASVTTGATTPTTKTTRTTKKSATKQRSSNKKKNNQQKEGKLRQQGNKSNKSNKSNKGINGKKSKPSPIQKQNHPKPAKRRQQASHNTPAKFAESLLFQSPDPSRLPPPKF